ncbi:tetratricopeptide repeat-containing sulfotransferase family protein [Aestuariivirga litoralis]|nr:sulfotransferase [Aestuariivirga litoralis]
MDTAATASDLFFKGLHALGKDDLRTAESCFSAALELVPGRPSVLTNLSIVHTRQGRLEEALALAQAAVKAEPGNPLLLLQLGVVQLKLGKAGEALISLEAASAADPSLAEACNGRGNALTALHRHEAALESFERAIRLKPGHAEAYVNRGRVLRLLGRQDEALASYRQAITLRPGQAEAHNNLGNLLKDLGRFDEALASYDTAIGLRPDYAEALSNRGNVLCDLNRLDEAEASYQHAAAAGGPAEAWLGLARIRSETGRFPEALEMYEKARRIDPDRVEALCGIAENRRFETDDPLIPEYDRLLALRHLTDEDRARLHHALGKISNDLARHDDAITHYGRGKRLLSTRFDLAGQARTYEALMATFDKPFFAARQGFGSADQRPVFVVGMPRSGTTLTEQILASHPRVEGLGELPDLPRLAKALGGEPFDAARFTAAAADLSSGAAAALARRYCEAYARVAPESLRLVDKQPHNYEWLGLIALMFPNARIIHCRRDPLDTCLSMYMQKFNGNHGYNQDLSVLGGYYRNYEMLMAHWHAVLPIAIHEVVYENVVADLEAEARALVSFIGLDWDAACLDFHLKERRVDTPSRWQVRQPLYDRSVGRWRHYERHLGPLRQALGLA